MATKWQPNVAAMSADVNGKASQGSEQKKPNRYLPLNKLIEKNEKNHTKKVNGREETNVSGGRNLTNEGGKNLELAASSKRKNGKDNLNDEDDWTKKAEEVLREEWRKQGGGDMAPGADEWRKFWFPAMNASPEHQPWNQPLQPNNWHKASSSNQPLQPEPWANKGGRPQQPMMPTHLGNPFMSNMPPTPQIRDRLPMGGLPTSTPVNLNQPHFVYNQQPPAMVPWHVTPSSRNLQPASSPPWNLYGEQQEWENVWKQTMEQGPYAGPYAGPTPMPTQMPTSPTPPSFGKPAIVPLTRPLPSQLRPHHEASSMNMREAATANFYNGGNQQPQQLTAGNLQLHAPTQLNPGNLQQLGEPFPQNQPVTCRVRRQVIKRYEMMIHECAKKLDGQEAMSILRYMWHQGLEPSIRAFTSTISTLTKGGQWQEALQLFISMNKYCGNKSNVYCYNAAMSACRKGKRWKLALDILRNMKRDELHPDVISYSTAISACEKSGKVDEALALLQEMKSDNMSPDVIIYSATISACEKGGKVDKAIDLLEEMQANEVHPDVITYNATISACEKGGASDAAIKLFRQMETKNISPDVISYTAAISACAKGGRHVEALALLSEMKEQRVEPSVITLSAAISACAKDGKYLEALSLLDGMKKLKIEPNVISYSAAISACGKASQWKHALNLLDDMKTQGVRPDAVTYNAIISACEHCGQWEESTNLYREAYDLWLFNHWRVGSPQAPQSPYNNSNEPLQANFLEYPLAAAKAALRMIMEDFMKSSQQRQDVIKPLIIIAGRGARREPVLLPGLLKMCNEEFEPSLDAQRVLNVPGRILVPAQSIRKWVTFQQGRLLKQPESNGQENLSEKSVPRTNASSPRK